MKRDSQAPCMTEASTGMAFSLLAEIAQRLEQLDREGEAAAIDLHGLPMTAADRARLDELLGRGEIAATLELAGRTEVWETGYPGVWWIRHLGANDAVATEEIAITRIPEILITHPADIARSAAQIRADLESVRAGASTERESSHA